MEECEWIDLDFSDSTSSRAKEQMRNECGEMKSYCLERMRFLHHFLEIEYQGGGRDKIVSQIPFLQLNPNNPMVPAGKAEAEEPWRYWMGADPFMDGT